MKDKYKYNNIVHRELIEQLNGFVERIVWKYFWYSLKDGTMMVYADVHYNSGGVDYYLLPNKEIADLKFDYSKWLEKHFLNEDDSDNYMIAHIHHDDILASILLYGEFIDNVKEFTAKAISHITGKSVAEVIKENTEKNNL